MVKRRMWMVASGFGILVASAMPGTATAANDGLAPTPPMGWNSWNKFACGGINETLIKQTADALVSSGLAAVGYVNLTLDDCWSAATRDGSGNLRADPNKFPSGMKAIGDYIHAKGLKYGIYASIGTATCTGKTPGSMDHENQDVAKFASWGVDYIKADRCNVPSGADLAELFGRWLPAIRASGRPMVLSASDNGGVQEPWSWGPYAAHQWRTTGDIRDQWARVLSVFDGNARFPGATVPGGFNDPDMLEVGNGGLTDTEYRAHMGLWALVSSPLIAGNDVRSMSSATKAILTHPEVLDIDQDGLAYQAIKAADDGAGRQVWYKPTRQRGTRAVGLFNRGDSTATISVSWTQIGLLAGSATVRDVWARADRGTFTNSYSVNVPAHGLALLRIVGTDPAVSTGYLSDQPWAYSTNGWGPVERNKSNGEKAAGDGKTLTLNGTTYTKGFGVHSPSAISFRPNGACSTFTANIGIDDEVSSAAASGIFQVWGDGKLLYDSGVMKSGTATKNVSVDISGRTDLRLEVAGGTDTTNSDHADWANARVTCAASFLEE
ncbi:NPCBM/NEW2 domain-containing protein [Pendulispora rubella]|uniref:Alpha-galactosidase n=1 Tax=Pendulispora rubella TaxID=2741070 RepID=A0ABZ2LHX7_9BACT